MNWARHKEFVFISCYDSKKDSYHYTDERSSLACSIYGCMGNKLVETTQ